MRQPTLRQLKIFATVGDQENLAAAGRVLGLSAATLSDAIRDLEAALGKPIFDRSSRKLRLSSDGKALLPDAKKLLRDAEALTARHGSRSVLYLGTSVTVGNYILPPLLSDFAGANPQTEIIVRIHNTDDIVNLVVEHEIEAAVIEGRVSQPELEVIPWRRDPLVIIAPPEHPLAASTDLAQLSGAPWVLRERGSGTRQAFDAATSDWPARAHVLMSVAGNELLKTAVIRGLGLGCIAHSAVAAEVRRGELVVLPLKDAPIERTLSIVHPARTPPRPILRSFIDLCLGASAASSPSAMDR